MHNPQYVRGDSRRLIGTMAAAGASVPDMRRTALLLLCAAFALLVPAPAAVAQSTEDFTFSSFDADYYLSRDDEGRASLRVVERLTAEFPDFDQNKGLVREIPRHYDGHTVSLSVESVTRNGAEEPIYDEYSSGENTVIETGTDDYVNGTQVYEFTYTMRDVILDDGAHQEFYWNTNGVEWRQPFEALTARVHLDESVRDEFTGAIRCIAGEFGAVEECDATSDGQTLTFTANRPLDAGENVTLVAMFEPGTFAPYDQGPIGAAARYSMIGAMLAALGVLGVVTRIRMTIGRSAPRNGPVSLQYAPPQGLSIIEAAGIQGSVANAIPAQILDLAVRGFVRIVEEEKKSAFTSSNKYSVELVHTDGLNPYERQLIDAFFPSGLAGARHNFADKDSDVTQQLQELQSTARKDAIQHGYRNRVKAGWKVFAIAGAAIVVSGIAAIILGNQPADWRYGLLAATFVAALIAIIAAVDIRPLTPRGRAVVDHLDGLKRYVGMNEKDRIAAMQAPGTAPTMPMSAFNSDQVVQLYERTLPYAVLFGQEKKWVNELSEKYEERHIVPFWYYGTQPFSTAHFSESMSGFVSSPGGPSASSGFSSSGGFSGGGGGGGGGGGR